MATTATVRDKRAQAAASTAKKSATTANAVEGKRGIDILHDPVINKATAYTEAERQALGLVGLVPDATETEDLQVRRVLLQLGAVSASEFDRIVDPRKMVQPYVAVS